jgi:diguanylate cyclase (GGDEF)-like protein
LGKGTTTKDRIGEFLGSGAEGTPDGTFRLLLDTVGELSLVSSLDEITQIVRTTARKVVQADGATFVLRDGERCYYADEDAIAPLWKGQHFPIEACVSGWAMTNRSAVVIEDIYADDRIPLEAYRRTFVRSLVMVPIRMADPLGAIGVYWATPHKPTADEVHIAQALADSTAVAVEHVKLLEKLALTEELTTTDPLTGIPNRRGWQAALPVALEPGRLVCMALIDIDEFKRFNDTFGHQAGDAQLRRCARAWRRAVRAHDLVARYGGEEFAVLLPDCDLDSAVRIAERLRAVVPAGSTASIGLAVWDGLESAAELTGRADAALYEAKRAGRDRVLLAS